MNVYVPPSPPKTVAGSSPITYNFTEGTFHAQKVTTALFLENPRSYCLNALGTGKTRSVLFAFDALRRVGLGEEDVV